MKARIIDKDLGMKGIVRSLKKVDGSYVKVGLQGNTGQKTYGEKWNRVTVVDVAVIHEFGATVHRKLKTIGLLEGLRAYYRNRIRKGSFSIPERSFLRSTYDEKYNEWRIKTNQIFFDLITKRFSASYTAGVSKALGVIGAFIKTDIKNKIRRGIPPPNAPSTLAKKMKKGTGGGQPVPLIDTGRMINSITFEKVIK